MNSKFVTPLIFSSALTLGALSFVACGEDSNPGFPGGQPTGNSSSSVYVPPEPTPTTAIVFSALSAPPSLTKIVFDGTLTLDLSDSNTVMDINAVRFTGVDFMIVKKETQVPQGTVNIAQPRDYVNTLVSTVSLSEMGVTTDLDVGYTDCGEFELIITAYADDGYVPSTSVARIPFTRSEEKCKVPESSSSAEPEAPGIPLTSVELQFNTKINRCFSAATGAISADETGDVCFKATSSTAIGLYSTTGFKFAIYNNRNDGDDWNDWTPNWLPDVPQTTSFTYLSSSLQETIGNFISEIGEQFVVGVAPTYAPLTGSAAGFVAFGVKESIPPDANGNVTMTLIIYKAAQ